VRDNAVRKITDNGRAIALVEAIDECAYRLSGLGLLTGPEREILDFLPRELAQLNRVPVPRVWLRRAAERLEALRPFQGRWLDLARTLREEPEALERFRAQTPPPGGPPEEDWIVASQAAICRALGFSGTRDGHIDRLYKQGIIKKYESLAPRTFRVVLSDPAAHARVKAALAREPKPRKGGPR
jgi:hypothetical protein